MVPVDGLTGPAQPIPTPSSSSALQRASCKTRPTVSNNSASPAPTPRPERVAKTARPWTFPAPSTAATAVFVPPMSMPIARLLGVTVQSSSLMPDRARHHSPLLHRPGDFPGPVLFRCGDEDLT